MVEFDSVPAMVEFVLTPNHSSIIDDHASSLHLCLHDLCPHVHAFQSIAREGIACGITDVSFNDLPSVSLCSLVKFIEASSCDANMVCIVYQLQTSSMDDK